MTDALETLRSQVEAATEGPWDDDVRDAIIITSSAIARFLASNEAEEVLATAIEPRGWSDEKPITLNANGWEIYKKNLREPALTKARAILTEIARRGTMP